jgi:hypothetical protein
MEILDCPDEREDERICSLDITGFSTGLVCGILMSSPGSSLMYFYFFASRVTERTLMKHCRTTASE